MDRAAWWATVHTIAKKTKNKKQLSTCTDNWKTQVRKIISGIESESDVTQSCPTLSDPMDYSLPGSSVHGIFQARVLEWGAIAFSTLTLNKGKKKKKKNHTKKPFFVNLS